MTDLNKMWDALAQYQPYADADGHGETWRVMCEERTREAAWEAWAELRSDKPWTAARAAAWEAKTAVARAWEAEYWSAFAIKRIEKAIKEREAAPSNIEPTSNVSGQAQTVDAQHSEIAALKAERDALLAEVERLKSVGYDLLGQLTVLRATKQMTAAINAARGDK